jgi:hypothetical protein
MNVAVLTIATVLTGSVILIELRWATRPPKAKKNHNSLMKTGKASRERNPFLLTGKRRWRLFRWILPRTGRAVLTNDSSSNGARPA